MNLTKNKNFIPFHVDTDVLWFQVTQYPAVGRLLSKIPVPTHHGEKYPYLLNTWKKILDPSLKIILFCSYPTRCKLWHLYECQVRTKIALTNNRQASWHFFFCDSKFWCWWLVVGEVIHSGQFCREKLCFWIFFLNLRHFEVLMAWNFKW